MKNQLIINIIAVVVVGVGAFFGGMQYQKSQINSQFPRVMGRNVDGQFGQQEQRAFGKQGSVSGMRPVSGEVTSVDSDSITVKMPDGSSKIVILPSTAKIRKTVDATKSDLVTGATVSITGTTNSDGTMTAESVSII